MRLSALILLLATGTALAVGPAMQTAPLPVWGTSASGPLMTSLANTSERLGDLVLEFDGFSSSNYGDAIGPITGELHFSVPFLIAQGWRGYAIDGATPPADIGEVMSQEFVICDPGTGGSLVMLFHFGTEHAQIVGLETDAPTLVLFGTTSGTATLTRVFEIDTLPTLAGARRNWYETALLATNPPAPAAPVHAIRLDALIVPEGLYATLRDPNEIVVAERPILSAMVQRYRTGLAPTNIPVNVEHAAAASAGRVTRLWTVAGSGLWARLEIDQAAADGHPFPSAEVRCLNATATDSWGTWGEFSIPWTLTGVALTASPALSVPRFVLRTAPDGYYPDPRTINGTWKRNQ